MEEFNQAANTEEVAAPQTESTETVAAESVTEQTQQEADVTQTQAFAQRLKESTTQAEQRARDQVIAEMYGESHGIKTYADYQQAIRQAQQQREAQEKGIDPEFYSKFSSMEEKLASIEREKTLLQQDNALSNDPNVGEFYKQYKPQVQEMAKQFNTDYDTALTLLLRENLPNIMSGAMTKAEQAALAKVTGRDEKQVLSSNDKPNNVQFNPANMSLDDIRKISERVQRGERIEF